MERWLNISIFRPLRKLVFGIASCINTNILFYRRPLSSGSIDFIEGKRAKIIIVSVEIYNKILLKSFSDIKDSKIIDFTI